MKVFTLKRTQTLPIELAEAWDFFSSPVNLSKITPAYMNFRIQSTLGNGKMYAGQIINYKVSPFPFVTVRWMTEITHVDEPKYFVDEQRFGPYSLWHHQHRFRQVKDGTEVIDEVHYALPLGLIGRLAHALFVSRQVNRIFDYRFKALESYFNSKAKHSTT